MKTYLIIGAIFIVTHCLVAGVAGFKGYSLGKTTVRNEWNESLIADKNEKIQTKRKQDAVYIAPVDAHSVNERLRSKTY